MWNLLFSIVDMESMIAKNFWFILLIGVLAAGMAGVESRPTAPGVVYSSCPPTAQAARARFGGKEEFWSGISHDQTQYSMPRSWAWQYDGPADGSSEVLISVPEGMSGYKYMLDAPDFLVIPGPTTLSASKGATVTVTCSPRIVDLKKEGWMKVD